MDDDFRQPGVIHLPDQSAPKPVKKKSGSDKRDMPVKMTFRVKESEKAAIEAAARREGITPGSYIRSRALSSPVTRPRRKPTLHTAALTKLLAHMGAARGSIYQIAKRLNFSETVHDYDLKAALDELRTAARGVIDAIGAPTNDY